MREFTKSLFSLSWAMSLFGIQQTTNMMSPEKAVRAFDSVTEAAQTELGEMMKSTFQAGDKLQRAAVDLTLGPLSGESLNPSKWTRMASDMAKQTTDVMTKGIRDVASSVQQSGGNSGERDSAAGAAATASQRQGWGPMPTS
jgi:hypothetical protein